MVQQPRRKRHLRLWIGLGVIAVVLALPAFFVASTWADERAWASCYLATRRGEESFTANWDWSEFGWVCRYTNGQGHTREDRVGLTELPER